MLLKNSYKKESIVVPKLLLYCILKFNIIVIKNNILRGKLQYMTVTKIIDYVLFNSWDKNKQIRLAGFPNFSFLN